MVAVSCSSCSATPTPASLVADAAAKGKLGSNEQKPGSVQPNKTTPVQKGDSVQISETARQQLSQSLQGLPIVNTQDSGTDVYTKPPAQQNQATR